MSIDGPWNTSEPEQPDQPKQPAKPDTHLATDQPSADWSEPPTDEPHTDKSDTDKKESKTRWVEPPIDEPGAEASREEENWHSNVLQDEPNEPEGYLREPLVAPGPTFTYEEATADHTATAELETLKPDSGIDLVPTRPAELPDYARPFKQELAERVPPYLGKHTTGLIDLGNGEDALLESGYDGPTKELPPPPREGTGMNNRILSHVEAHAAATMRLTGMQDATLYINRVPCAGVSGCEAMLPRMVPRGSKLTIYGPNYVRVVVGEGVPPA